MVVSVEGDVRVVRLAMVVSIVRIVPDVGVVRVVGLIGNGIPIDISNSLQALLAMLV